MRKLVEYLPSFLREIREYKEICAAEGNEIKKLEERMLQIIQEVSIETAQTYGLNRYEKILDIVNTSTNIEERRFKIKAKLMNQLPFNKKWLENKLKSLVGKGNYKIKLDCDHYEITIHISHIFEDVAKLMKQDLRNQLPANLVVIVDLYRTEVSNIYCGGVVHIGRFIKVGGVI